MFSQNIVMSRDSDFWQAEARYGVGLALESFLTHNICTKFHDFFTF